MVQRTAFLDHGACIRKLSTEFLILMGFGWHSHILGLPSLQMVLYLSHTSESSDEFSQNSVLLGYGLAFGFLEFSGVPLHIQRLMPQAAAPLASDSWIGRAIH